MLSRNNVIITDTNHIVRLLLYCPHCILPSWFCVLSSCHLYLVRNCTQSNNVSDFSDSVHVIMIVIMMPCHYCLTVSPTNEDVHVSDPPRAGLSWRPCSSQYLIYNSKTQYSAAPATSTLYSIQGDTKNYSLRRSRVDQQLFRSHFVRLCAFVRIYVQ